MSQGPRMTHSYQISRPRYRADVSLIRWYECLLNFRGSGTFTEYSTNAIIIPQKSYRHLRWGSNLTAGQRHGVTTNSRYLFAKVQKLFENNDIFSEKTHYLKNYVQFWTLWLTMKGVKKFVYFILRLRFSGLINMSHISTIWTMSDDFA